ncbi:cndp dipeptidase [Phaffia rhodozyma]|uniref:Cndp dipeptidase n=1 Tax=Phaffia rhodozyma TaxID=264483 RepID=A0A0F7SSB9_PHARH|nr:cndp dipeptidase [Phaffia rhodozyma]
MTTPAEFLTYVDEHAEQFIDRLAKAVAIPSVSGEASYRKHVFEMADFMASQLESLGCDIVKKVPLGEQVLEGQTLQLPPAVLASLGDDPKKKTILLYGHYDVQPALVSDGWDTDPFVLTPHEDGRLIGRGSSDDKGPILGWLNVIEAHKNLGLELPVNLKMCFEGMEESGSEGLDELIEKEKDGFFKGVDACCISDNYWLNTTTPALTYGLRGIAYFGLKVSGPARDLHSGVFGGVVHEPMTDLIHLLSTLVQPSGKITIPGLSDLVAPLTDQERKRYEAIHFETADIEASTGSKTAISEDKVESLMAKMREPSLSLHGIEGAFYSPGSKTVIPATVVGKFSIRLVPDMMPEEVTRLVTTHIQSEFKKLNSKNTIEIDMGHGGKPWVADPEHWNYRAAFKATETVYKQKPDLTREGGSIPVTLSFADALKINVLLLPMGRGDDGAHSINEKLDRSNYINGTKVLGAYLHEIAAVTK